jgi:hypothetical protein
MVLILMKWNKMQLTDLILLPQRQRIHLGATPMMLRYQFEQFGSRTFHLI